MGSLMAGWDSEILNNKPELSRSRFLTKEEIDNFWKARRLLQEEHLRAAADLIPNTAPVNEVHVQDSYKELPSVEDELEKLNSYKDWWTKSTWAFLNDNAMKRLENSRPTNYTAQFHVATSHTMTSPTS